MERHEQIDQLHQQAAAQYLQGEFDAAMESWRRLLSLDPEDERAREGLRLCEMLAEEGDGVLSPGSDIQTPGAEQVDLEPETAVDSAPAWDLGAVDGPPTSAPDPARQGQGIDPGADPEPLSLDLDALGEPGESFDAVPATSDAASELESRVAELLAEARAARDAGDADHALSVLSRVFILDEENAEAEALQAELQPHDEPDQNAEEQAMSAEEAPILGDLDLAVSDEIGAATAVEAPAPPAVQHQTEATPAMPEIDLPSPGEPGPPADSYAETATPSGVPGLSEDPAEEPPLSFDEFDEKIACAPAPSRVVVPSRSLPIKPIAIGGAALLALAGSFAAWKMFTGGEPDAGVEPEPVAVRTPAADAEPSAAAENEVPEPPADTAAPSQVPVVASDETVAEIIERASLAMENGDYAQAVVGFNQALTADPGNRLAQEGLAAAGGYYREHKELIESIERARAAFDNEDYRGALKIIYRLPENAGDPTRYDRWKTNGWFNLGVGALHGGNCTEAREHFGEARVMDPGDPQIASSIELAKQCRQTPKPPGYFDRIAVLAKRTLDD